MIKQVEIQAWPIQFSYAALLSVAVSLCFTGNIRADDFWDNHSVVYGILESRVVANEHRHFVSKFRPQMTLTGAFDAGLHDVIDVEMTVGGLRGALSDPPARRHAAILVLKKSEDKWSVPNSTFGFMPLLNPMVLVEGPADPKVFETIELIKKTHKRATGFRVMLKITLKPEAKQRGIKFGQIQDRIYAVIPKLREIDKKDIPRIPFRDGEELTVGDLADIEVTFRSPEGFQRLK